MAERIIVQLQHANSAVVLTTIKVLLYLMNYMEDRRLIDYICKKMGPPLGMSPPNVKCMAFDVDLTRAISWDQLRCCRPVLKFNMWLCGTSY